MGVRQQFVERAARGEYAQNKAHDDIVVTLDRLGFSHVEISRKMTGGRWTKNWERIKWLLKCPFWRMKIKPNATIFVQYTITCWQGALAFRLLDEKLKARKNLKIIALIHDVNRSDVTEDRLTEHEKRFFAMCDTILVHCENMKAFFARHGVDERKLQIFEAFDYLTDVPMNPLTTEHPNTINICGNLSPHKCGCCRELGDISGVDWKLYGPNFSAAYAAENVEYKGEAPSDELTGKLKHGFGLIWDGDSVDALTGLFGAYQKINHPHKLSLYLAAGIPVIVWEKSGVARFVTENKVGFAVASLRDVPMLIKKMEINDYLEWRRNAMCMGEKLRFGKMIGNLIEKSLRG